MKSTMMDMPLSIQMILEHGRKLHSTSRVASFDGQQFEISCFGDIALRAEALAAGLTALGVSRGECVATYCWNRQEHLEAYLAVPCMGSVLHTLNIRLLPEQVARIMVHAGDRVLIVDRSLLPQLAPVLNEVATLEHVLVVGGVSDDLPALRASVVSYEDVLGSLLESYDWTEPDERDAAVVCYTTGTTGDPKGIVYSHRSVFLHTLATLGRDTFGIGQDDRILLLPSMFHANAWGLPYSAWFAGADLLLPREYLKPTDLRRMIDLERPTITALVPTLMNDLLREDESEPLDLSCFRAIVSGGSAVSPGLIRRVRDRWGVPMLQGWGMTETSPMCCLSIPPRDATVEEQFTWRAKSGRPVPGMQVRVVDDNGSPLPEDGRQVGELQLRGPWVTGAYHGGASPESFTADGWLRTGDVGTVDGHGYVQITDRSKDVIKSGGEWVSSVDLENQLSQHPAVDEVAVIGIPDPRWEERPLALVVPRAGQKIDPAELQAFLDGRVARFWIPEYWSVVGVLPKTSVNKIDKRALRGDYEQGRIQPSLCRPSRPATMESDT
ncbi:MAG: fatty-acid--CoA ligase [Gammaproteobacteria bacterium]|nr:MAG: fatty-acid--CoA ligase [Gammaproteobacteria bacterium]